MLQENEDKIKETSVQLLLREKNTLNNADMIECATGKGVCAGVGWGGESQQ